MTHQDTGWLTAYPTFAHQLQELSLIDEYTGNLPDRALKKAWGVNRKQN